MSSQRGLKLLLSVLAFPAGAGTIAHVLSKHYQSLMNFDGRFFLVKATQELYDTGIPKVPKDVREAAKWILEKEKVENSKGKGGKSSRKKRETKNQPLTPTSASPEKEQEKPEIFEDDSKNKKYWCRYFDYSGGKDNVIMQYDPFCTLYNVFDLEDLNSSPQQAGTSNTDQNKQITIKLNDFQNKTKNLETKRLKRNSEFKRGGFYVLRLDKNKIPNVNSTFTIEITQPGTDKWKAEKTYQPKISEVKIQAQLTGDPLDSVKLTFSDPFPSSRLLVKKVKDETITVDSPTDSTAQSPSSDDEDTAYYFKNSTNGEEKLYVEHAWSFGNGSQVQGTKVNVSTQKQKFDLSTLDEAPLKNFGTSTKFASPSPGDKYYIFKNVSDFWRYKVGERIELYKLTKSKNGDQQQGTEQEKKIETFEVVAGVLVNLSSTLLRCVSGLNGQESSSSSIKPNLQAKHRLIDISQDTNGDYCKKDEPTHVLVLVGYNGDV